LYIHSKADINNNCKRVLQLNVKLCLNIVALLEHGGVSGHILWRQILNL